MIALPNLGIELRFVMGNGASWVYEKLPNRGGRTIAAPSTRKPQPPRLKSISTSSNRPLTWWTIYKLAARQTWIGVVEATDEREAVEKAAAEFKQYAPKLMAVARR